MISTRGAKDSFASPLCVCYYISKAKSRYSCIFADSKRTFVDNCIQCVILFNAYDEDVIGATKWVPAICFALLQFRLVGAIMSDNRAS